MTSPEGLSPPPTKGSLSSKAVKGFVWAMASWGGNRILVFASTLALTWILIPSEFGVVAAALAVVTFFEVALDVGVNSALIYEQEDGHSERVQTAFTTNLALASVLAIGLVLLAPVIAGVFGMNDDVWIFRSLGLFLVLRGLVQTPDAVLRRDMDFRTRAKIEISRALLRSVLAVALALQGLGAWSVVISLLVAQLYGVAATWILVRFRPTFVFDRTVAGQLMTFGLPVLGIRVVQAFIGNSDYVIVANRLGDEALGSYQIGYRIPELLIGGLLIVVTQVLFSSYSSARTKGEAALRSGMLQALRYVGLFAFAVGIMIALMSQDVIDVLVSPPFRDAATPMAFIALGSIFHALGFASGNVFPAVNRARELLLLNTALLVVAVTILWIVAPRGINWVAGAWLPIAAAYAVVRIELAHRLVGATRRQTLEALWPGLVAGAGVTIVGGCVRWFVGVFAWPPVLSASAICIGSVAGAVGGLALGSPHTFNDLRRLAARVRA